MHNLKFNGIGVALVTPFTPQGTVDEVALSKLVNYVINNGVDYLVVQGSTGEAATLTATEKVNVLNIVQAANNKRKPIVLGIGGNNTAEVINSLSLAHDNDVQGILSVSPYYNKPSQQGIILHYSAIAQATHLPLILYNVPGRTGSNIAPSTIATLAMQHSNIVAVKEASGNIAQNADIISLVPPHFTVLSGDDDLVLPQIALGMHGVISVAANCYTSEFCTMVNNALQGNYKAAQPLFYKLLPGIKLLFADGNPSGVKYVLHKMGIIHNCLRLPLIPVNDAVAQAIDGYLASENANI
jgi:4-hydroxy-tetrahydrodipicolinate synthase